jgi:hypothetical protein
MANLTLPSDFAEFLSLAQSRGARILVFGGFAVSIHARPRATGDIDLWIGPDATTRDAIRATLRDFGFSAEAVRLIVLDQPHHMTRFGVEPNRIELFTSVADLDFEACWMRRTAGTSGSLGFSVLSKPDLIASKIAAGRPRDLADPGDRREHEELRRTP